MAFERKTADTTLYRQFDKDGMLLYVGISLKLGQRTSQHRRMTPWFKSIASITLEHFDTLKGALAAEKIAIDTENPQWNQMRNFAPPKSAKWKPSIHLPLSRDYPVTSSGMKMRLLPGGIVVYDLPDIL